MRFLLIALLVGILPVLAKLIHSSDAYPTCRFDFEVPERSGLHRFNRDRVLNDLLPGAIGQEVIVAVGGRGERDARNDSPWLWLTGFRLPNALVASSVQNGRTLMFIERTSTFDQVWDGPQTTFEYVLAEFDVDAVYFEDEMLAALNAEFPNIARVHAYDEGALRSVASDVANAFPLTNATFRNRVQFHRQFKSPQEIELMRVSSYVSAMAHREVMAHVTPEWNELEVESLFKYECQNCFGRYQAYTPIVAAGSHGSSLHYIENEHQLAPDDVLLIDAGMEYFSYATDITRTWPVDGTFDERQELIYDIVKQAADDAMALVRPGERFASLNAAANEAITEGMLAMQFCGSYANCDRIRSTFYMHSLGHGVGLDVHDGTTLTTLEEGHVFTIEPGFYFNAANLDDARNGPNALLFNWPVIDTFLDFGGVRIEDTILVTADGYENLSAAAPRERVDIEAVMQGVEEFDKTHKRRHVQKTLLQEEEEEEEDLKKKRHAAPFARLQLAAKRGRID